MIFINKHEYTKNELIDILIKAYDTYKTPITVDIIENDKTIPTRKVFQRLFGSWKNACDYAKIPYNNPKSRLGEEQLNNQGCLMKIIEYNNARDIIVEFQDKYKAKVHAAYKEFESGGIRNPYYSDVYNVGIIGNKYPSRINGQLLKEYKTWSSMLLRCFDIKYQIKEPTYKDATCCEEWLLYENFYEWLHSQENFDKWLNEDYAIDKDIIVKNNKIYSPDTCCLVPRIVNSLFIKRTNERSVYPIGVTKHNDRYRARCDNPLLNIRKHIGVYDTPKEAFNAYKKYKENVIKKVAQIEFDNGNITKECYDALLKYEVEITD